MPAVSHIGLIPYKSTWTGGFKAVGKDAESALKVYQDAIAYDNAGAIGLEVECVFTYIVNGKWAKMRC